MAAAAAIQDMEIEIDLKEIQGIFKILGKNMLTFIDNNSRESLNIDDYNFRKLMFFMQGYVLKTVGELFILKMSKCQDASAVNDKNCYRLKNNIIYTTPQPPQLIVSLPDTVSENVIGYLLNNIVPYTPNFVKNYGMVWKDHDTYSFIETLKTDLFSPNVLQTGENLVIAILQYLHGLSVAQQTYYFTHNDCHLENILYKDEAKTTVWNKVYLNVCKDSFSTRYTTHEFYVKNPGWNIKINDYGLSRITYYNNKKSYVGIPNNLRNFNKFSHCVDYLTLFGCLFYLGFTSHPNADLTNKVTQLRDFINKNTFLAELAKLNGFNNPYFLFFHIVCPFLFKKNMTVKQLTNSMNTIYNNKNTYRPFNNSMFLYSHLFETPDQAFINLANLNYPPNVNLVSVRRSVQDKIKEYSNYTVLYSNIPVLKNIPNNIVNISPDIIYQRLEYLDTKSEYNIADTINSCDLKQIVHVCKISANAIKNGFNFISECCGLEPSDIFEKENKFGVAINGVFFDILKSNLPIGYYKDKNINNIYHNLPEEYRNYYAIIGFNNDTTDQNNLIIEAVTEVKGHISDIAKKYSFLAVAGPILIKDKWQFSEKEVNISQNNINIFQCVNPTNNIHDKILDPGIPITRCKNGVETTTQTITKHPNCTNISAGELSHGGNVNPRTAIAYNPTQNCLYFIVIEGRNNRGGGQDFVKMAKTMKKLDPGITRAVNLDGGGSSNMAFREVGKNYINIVNPDKAAPYPVGNIFGVISK